MIFTLTKYYSGDGKNKLGGASDTNCGAAGYMQGFGVETGRKEAWKT
jgi:hypothetical protein